MTLWINYKNGKRKKAKMVVCEHCGEEFTKAITEIKRQEHHFCSRECYFGNKSKKHRVTLECNYCGESFERIKSKVHSNYNFCSKKCLDRATRIGSGEEFDGLRPHFYQDGSSNYRARALEYYPEECNRCGYDNNKALVAHHKDGDRKNNSIKNLEILCANCHMIEHTER